MKTVFFTITTPIAVRNFFLIPNGVLEILKSVKEVKIVVLVPEQAHAEVKKDFEGGNVVVEATPVAWQKTMLQRAVDFFTKYLNFTDLMRTNATRGGSRIDIPLRERKRHLFPVKAGIAATFGKSWWVRNVLAPKFSLLVYRKRPYRHLFDKYKPDLVFVTNILGEQGLEALREARRQGVPSIGMTESWDHFPKRYESIKTDTLLVWHQTSGKEAITLQDYAKEKVFITGVPQYDLFAKKNFLLPREDFFKKCGLDGGKKLITLFSSTKYSPDDGDIVAILLDFIKKRKLVADCQLFVRPYPGVKSDHKKFDAYDGMPGVYIDWTPVRKIWGTASSGWYPERDSFIWTMNILYYSDIIINTYSSVSIEGSAFLKPIININFDGYKRRPPEQSIKRFEKNLSHYRHVLETKGVRQAESAEDLLTLLNEFLRNPDANKENLIKLRDKMCGPIDGRSSERIAGHILKALSSSGSSLTFSGQ